jgi:hypothetical protein
MKMDAVLHQKLMDLHACAVPEGTLDLAFIHAAGTVGVGEECFEGGACGVLAGGAELVGEGVRDVERDLHGGRVHLGWGWRSWLDEFWRLGRLRFPPVRKERVRMGHPGFFVCSEKNVAGGPARPNCGTVEAVALMVRGGATGC